MTNRYRIGAALGIVALLGLAFLFTRDDTNTLSVKVRTITEENESFEIRAEYPEFPKFSKSFNRKIENLVIQNIAEFKKTSDENRTARAESGDIETSYPYTLSIGWAPSEFGPERVSFLIRSSYYTGGAHGSESIETFTFDAIKRQEVTLDTLFQDVPNYLNRISQFTLGDLKERLQLVGGGTEPNMEMLTQGTAPIAKNFEKFTLGPGNIITFYFPAYQVAAYSYGEQRVIMPLSYILSEDITR